MVTLGDDIAMHLDIAMLARREGLPGETTPEGILTRLKDTTFGRMIDQIEASNDPDIGELGLLLLQLGENTARSLGSGIDTLANLARKDRRPHDLSLELGDTQSGLTVHCRYRDSPDVMETLAAHCELRKYSTKSDSWYGLLIDPDTREIQAGFGSHQPWQPDPTMDELVEQWPTRPQVPWSAVNQQAAPKVGRNDPCPCGSAKKYKKCCLNA